MNQMKRTITDKSRQMKIGNTMILNLTNKTRTQKTQLTHKVKLVEASKKKGD